MTIEMILGVLLAAVVVAAMLWHLIKGYIE